MRDADAAAISKEIPAVEYARRLYVDALGWDHCADTKAQVLLGFDGAFLAFVAAAAFQKPEDLGKLIDNSSPYTWALLALVSLTLVTSMAAAVYCIWSRIYFASSLEDWIKQAKISARTTMEYPADVMWFFQHLAALEPQRFRHTLANADSVFELHAMAAARETQWERSEKTHCLGSRICPCHGNTLALCVVCSIVRWTLC